MGVNVDEPRRDDAAARVDLRRVGRGDAADGGNAIAGDADIGEERRCAGAIDNRTATDHQVERLVQDRTPHRFAGW
jgi:hypothetical protein